MTDTIERTAQTLVPADRGRHRIARIAQRCRPPTPPPAGRHSRAHKRKGADRCRSPGSDRRSPAPARASTAPGSATAAAAPPPARARMVSYSGPRSRQPFAGWRMNTRSQPHRVVLDDLLDVDREAPRRATGRVIVATNAASSKTSHSGGSALARRALDHHRDAPRTFRQAGCGRPADAGWRDVHRRPLSNYVLVARTSCRAATAVGAKPARNTKLSRRRSSNWCSLSPVGPRSRLASRNRRWICSRRDHS